MNRAAVLIGVDRSGGLPALQDAAKGARRMEEWARRQGMDPVVVFTDEGGGAVEVGDIKRAIKKIVKSDATDQLLVYFAGHGVNIRYGEFWLLSDAPNDTQAAVNLTGSATLAAYSGIPYVVFVSDACRSAAQGTQAQFVMGSEIFPNDGVEGPEQAVDRFYACLLGAPAHEIKDPAVAASEYSALYTDALLDAFDGMLPNALEWVDESGERVGYVRPRPLKKLLPDELARRLRTKGLLRVIQVPDAHIVSEDDAWLSRSTPDDGDAPPSPPQAQEPPPPPAPLEPPPREPSARLAVSTATSLLRPALSGDLDRLENMLRRAGAGTAREKPGRIERDVRRVREPFGPSHHETECGFKIRGARIVEAFSPHVSTSVSPAGDDVRAEVAPPGASVLLVFHDGSGTLLPAIPGYLAALDVDGDELVDVAYEPSENNWRWNTFAYRAAKARALRAVIASAAREGVFRLEGDDAERIAREMQSAKAADPTLAIYAAYAYHDLQLVGRIVEMAHFMRRDLDAALFDVALLARELIGKPAGRDPHVLSFMPLLGQGWALLDAFKVQLPGELDEIQRTLRSSLWTMFDAAGVEQVRAALQAGATG